MGWVEADDGGGRLETNVMSGQDAFFKCVKMKLERAGQRWDVIMLPSLLT